MYLYMVCCGNGEGVGDTLSAWDSAERLRKAVFERCFAENEHQARETAEICLTGRLLEPETASADVEHWVDSVVRDGEDTLLVAGSPLMGRVLRCLGAGIRAQQVLRPGDCRVVRIANGRAVMQRGGL